MHSIVNSVPSPYYGVIIDKVNECATFRNFPLLKNKDLYKKLYKTKHVTVEQKYPQFSWKHIWYNFSSSHINLFEKDFVYKHLHDVLTVRK